MVTVPIWQRYTPFGLPACTIYRRLINDVVSRLVSAPTYLEQSDICTPIVDIALPEYYMNGKTSHWRLNY
jgi:hypothetical protein